MVNKEQVKKARKIKLWQGWSAGVNFGITKFKGDIAQYDHYPAYQDTVNFFELKRAIFFMIAGYADSKSSGLSENSSLRR